MSMHAQSLSLFGDKNSQSFIYCAPPTILFPLPIWLHVGRNGSNFDSNFIIIHKKIINMYKLFMNIQSRGSEPQK